jgi:hypothetical protein
MRFTRLHYTLAFVVAFLLVTAGALFSQDSTVAVPDKTGLLGPIIDHFWEFAITLATSGTVWLIARLNEGFAKTHQAVKWLFLYGFALGYNLLAGWLGLTPLDAVAPALGLAMVQGTAAALVYKLAGHKTPILTASRPI